MKKLIFLIVLLSFVTFAIWRKWDNIMPVIDEYFPEFTVFHNLSEEDEVNLSEMFAETLRCFDLKPLNANEFFTIRFSYYWEDGCEYRQLLELKCEDENFNNCSTFFFTKKNGLTNVDAKSIAKLRIQQYREELASIGVLKMKSIKVESFFEHFDMIQRSGSVSYRFFEVSMDNQKNVFGIKPGPINEKKYLNLMSSTNDLLK